MNLTLIREHSNWIALVVCFVILTAIIVVSHKIVKSKKSPNAVVEKRSTIKTKSKTEPNQSSELLLYMFSSLWILYKAEEEDHTTLINKTTFTLGVLHLIEGFYKDGLPNNSVIDEIEELHGSMSNWKAKLQREIEQLREASRKSRLKSGQHVKQKVLPTKFFAPI
jgi:hypothetical protein